MLEFLDSILRPFGQCLDTAIVEISYVTAHLMPRGGALSEIAKSDALHLAADQEFSGDDHPN